MYLSIAIHTLSPVGYVAVCLLVSVAFTWLLYNRGPKFDKPWYLILAALRFLAGFLLFSLLLSPFISLRMNREAKPELLVYFDKSLSTAGSGDLYKKVQKSVERLNEKYNIRYFDFGGNVVNAGDSILKVASTDLGAVAAHCNEFGESRNASSILVLTDGIYNRGQSPLFVSQGKNPKVFTLGLGDTTQYPDIKVSAISLNESVFLGSEFILETTVTGKLLSEKAWTAILSENGKEVARKTGAFSSSDGFERLEFRIKAASPGLKQYSVNVVYKGSESNKINNTITALTEVVDTRKKIQIAMHSVHPDIGALRRVIEDQARYTLQVSSAGELPSSGSADIFVLHGMPANTREATWLESLRAANKPFWIISSVQTAPDLLGQISGVGIPAAGEKTEDAQAYADNSFGEFEPEPGWDKKILAWPPLKVKYGRFVSNATHKVLLRQKIGSVETGYPLLLTKFEGKNREAYLLGEGLWKWKMKDYTKGEGSQTFDDLIIKLVQYLGASNSDKKFVCRSQRRDYDPGEPVVLQAENRDAAGNLNNEPECNLKIEGPQGFSKSVKMARNNKTYRYDLGSLPAGTYNFRASLDGGAGQSSAGVFFVNDAGLEKADKVANHAMLRQWAIKTGGQFYKGDDYEKAIEQLNTDNLAIPVIYEEHSVTDLIHAKWFFLLIVVLLSVEWIIRKYLGQY